MQKSREQENQFEEEHIGYSIVHHLAIMETDSLEPFASSDTILASVENWLILNNEVRGKSRKRELVDQRRVICYILKKYTKLSLENIGKIIGGKDHATVLYGVKTHKHLTQMKDQEYLYNTRKINKLFKNLL